MFVLRENAYLYISNLDFNLMFNAVSRAFLSLDFRTVFVLVILRKVKTINDIPLLAVSYSYSRRAVA